MKKRILSILLAMCMLMSLLPVAAFAADGEDVEIAQPEQSGSKEGNTPEESTPNENTPTDGAQEEDSPEPAPSASREATDVVKANLHDTREPQLVTDAELAAGCSISVGNATVDSNVTTVPVTLTHTGLRAHANGANQMGFWIGVGVPKFDGVSYYGKFGQLDANTDITALSYNKSPVSSQTENSKPYDTFYFNATAKAGNGTYTLIQKSGSGTSAKYVVYKITLNVTRKLELDNKTGFYWRTEDKPGISGIDDWRPQTMLVSLVDDVPVNEFLWADIEAPNGKVYGIYFGAGSIGDGGIMTVYKNFAWSFLTQNQFEQWPEGVAVGVQSLGNYKVTIYELPTEPGVNATTKPEGATEIVKTTIPVVSDLPAATVGYTSLADTTIVDDCVAKTMYVRFANAVPNNTYLWFEITDPNNKVYEIGANAEDGETTKFAWSFTNQGQFEKWPAGVDAGKVASGTYTVKAYLSPDKITAEHKTSGKPAGCVELWTKTVEVSDTAVVTPAPTQPTLSGSIKEEDKAAVTAAASSIKVESPAALANAAQDKANEAGQINEDTAKNALTSSGVTVAANAKVTVVVQPYLAVEAQTYDAAEKTLVVDITAMSRTVATTADVENNADIKVVGDTGVTTDANAATIGSATPLNVNDPITLSIQLPDGYAVANQSGYIDIFVKHTKDGKAH